MDATAIKTYTLRNDRLSTVVTNLTSGIAVDYDLTTMEMFYTDVATHVVYSSYLMDYDEVTSVEEVSYVDIESILSICHLMAVPRTDR